VALENLLRVAFANLLLRRDACLVHAAAAVEGEAARVVFGFAGAGKSRLARRAGARPLVSDDLVALVLEAGRVFVERVPFFGEFPPEDRAPGRYRVLSLDALSPEGGPSLEPLPKAAAVARLAACLPFLDAAERRRLPLVTRLLEVVPARELRAGDDPDPWGRLATATS
jgi:hypothetical protein